MNRIVRCFFGMALLASCNSKEDAATAEATPEVSTPVTVTGRNRNAERHFYLPAKMDREGQCHRLLKICECGVEQNGWPRTNLILRKNQRG
jgi:hypothetical protein